MPPTVVTFTKAHHALLGRVTRKYGLSISDQVNHALRSYFNTWKDEWRVEASKAKKAKKATRA